MKTNKLFALLLLPVLAGPLAPVQAQISAADTLALISEMRVDNQSSEAIVNRLLDEGLTLEEILALLQPYMNAGVVEELLRGLIEFGLPTEDAAAMIISMHSVEEAAPKLVEIEGAGITREMGSRLLVVLSSRQGSRERMALLTGELGMATQEAAQLLIFLTIRPGPGELLRAMIAVGIDTPMAATLLVANNATMASDAMLEAMIDEGLSLAQATDIIIATDSTATFAQPLAEIVSQVFTPSNFSNDALTGAAGGGVSTSQ
jgi:hypothetical protein